MTCPLSRGRCEGGPTAVTGPAAATDTQTQHDAGEAPDHEPPGNPAAPGIVYLITHPKLGAHKVGITNTGGYRLGRWRKRGWEAYRTLELARGEDARAVEQAVLRWWRHDLGHLEYLDAVQCPNGWTETICSDAVDLPAIWARVVVEAANLPSDRSIAA